VIVIHREYLESIQPDQIRMRAFDITSYRDDVNMNYFLPSLKRRVTLSLVKINPEQLIIAAQRGSTEQFDVYLDNETLWRFKAFIIRIDVHSTLDAYTTCTVSLQLDGQARIHQLKENPVSNMRTGIQIPKGAEGKRVLRERQYYVGSKNILPGGTSPGWGKPTLEAALEHARELIDQDGTDQFIVKIVRVVRRKKTPNTVEKV
jgi:hypothetical protein